MIGAGFGVTGAAAGGPPRRRRNRRRAARASVAARRRAHGGRESRAGADASLGAFGAATTAAAGTAVRTVGRDDMPVAADTVTGRAGVARSPTCLPEREALACCSCGLEGQRVFVGTGVRARCDRRLADAGRAATAGAAPAGAVPRTVSFAGDDSAGAGSTDPGADCRAGVEGVGAAAGDGAGGRGGSSVSGST